LQTSTFGIIVSTWASLITVKGKQMKDYKGNTKDFFWGAVAAGLMLAPAMVAYVYKTGGIN